MKFGKGNSVFIVSIFLVFVGIFFAIKNKFDRDTRHTKIKKHLPFLVGAFMIIKR